MFFKTNKKEAKRALESLEKAQAILDSRYQAKQIPMDVYQKQCQEFGKRREKLQKVLGEDLFNENL